VDLSRRLAQLDALLKAPRSAAPPDAAARASAPADPAAGERLSRRLGLAAVAGAGGEVWTRDDRHSGLPPPSPDALAALGRALAPWTRGGAPAAPAPSCAEEILLLDTETTGLAGGTGTLVFLIGCAWWEGADLRTRQWFLPAPGREAPLLGAVADAARGRRVVATYNGAMFDLPLLRTRALLSRLPDPCAELSGWDLLRAARRLWGRRLPDCRQPTVEALVCGTPRDADDLPGALAPQAWFRWLRAGDGGDLEGVLEHNRRDLRGLAAILLRAARSAQDLDGPPGGAGGIGWQDAWSAGRLHARARRTDLAAAWIEAALAGLPEPAAAPEALYADAVRLLKRAGAWERAAQVLDLAHRATGGRPWIHLEAAILYEHRLRRLDRAWEHARSLGDARRLARLARKGAPTKGRDA